MLELGIAAKENMALEKKVKYKWKKLIKIGDCNLTFSIW